MPIYRMSVPASICFDIEAESQGQAVRQAAKAMEDFTGMDEGVDLDGLAHGRLYPCFDQHPLVVDEMPPDDEPEAS